MADPPPTNRWSEEQTDGQTNEERDGQTDKRDMILMFQIAYTEETKTFIVMNCRCSKLGTYFSYGLCTTICRWTKKCVRGGIWLAPVIALAFWQRHTANKWKQKKQWWQCGCQATRYFEQNMKAKEKLNHKVWACLWTWKSKIVPTFQLYGRWWPTKTCKGTLPFS